MLLDIIFLFYRHTNSEIGTGNCSLFQDKQLQIVLNAVKLSVLGTLNDDLDGPSLAGERRLERLHRLLQCEAMRDERLYIHLPAGKHRQSSRVPACTKWPGPSVSSIWYIKTKRSA